MGSDIGKTLIVLGLLIAAAGLLIHGLGRIPGIGRLPGDLVIRRKGLVIYLPLATSLLLSLLLSLVFWFFGRK